MKRSGFTLIELVFVIVIIGILAAVAIPRLAGVQDDATIASEQAGIGAARTGVQGLRGRIMLATSTGLTTFNAGVTDAAGVTHQIPINVTGANVNVTNGNPNFLSTNAAFGAMGTAASTNSDATLALVLEPGSRLQWTTIATANANAVGGTGITGPASRNITDANALIHTGLGWTYNPTAGTITGPIAGF